MTRDLGFLDVIFSTRAIRRFRTDEVSKELIRKILEAAIQAPNGNNKQPWRFIVVRDPLKKSYLGKAYLQGSADYQGISVNQLLSEESQSSVNYLACHFSEAPVLLVICAESPQEGISHNAPAELSSSIFPAVQNILLAARFYGLGGVITISNRFQDHVLTRALAIPKGWSISTVIPIGYPFEKHGPKSRKPIELVTYSDNWNADPEF